MPVVPTSLSKPGKRPRRRDDFIGAGVRVAVLLAAVVALPMRASAQEAAPPPAFTPLFENLTRVSGWSYFEPPPGGGDHQYSHLANRLRIGVRRVRPRYDVVAALQYVQLAGLPRRATGPGALGDGALYFDHAGRTNPAQVYVRQLNVRLPSSSGNFSVQAGRMGYSSGGEAPSGVPRIDALRERRVSSRLIGEFEWSLFQRGFDGLRVDWKQPSAHVTAAALRPTQGGFEESAGSQISDIDLLVGAVTLQPTTVVPRTQAQVFAYHYGDERPVSARPDNTGRAADRVDVSIATFGSAMTGSYPAGNGEVDVVLWVAGQTGRWYSQRHRAASVAAEAGYEWTRAAWRPWVRAGLLHASGDPDPADDRHGTFFQMLPTGRKYSLSASYSQMNLNERFVEVLLTPHARVKAVVAVRTVSLAEAADGWYAGSGATQQAGRIFGYAMRPSRGATGLGRVVEGAIDVRLAARSSINAYVGHIRGGDVVRRTFAGRHLLFAYVEHLFRL